MAKILVIDDDDGVREGVAAVCERMGHEVHPASDGRSGLTDFERFDADLVITDLKMDDVDGLAVLRGVKQKSPQTEVMLMTAFGSVDSAVAAMKDGAFDYIEKPFRPDALRVRVDRALAAQTLKQENDRLRAANESFQAAVAGSSSAPGFYGMIGESDLMQTLFARIERVAGTDAPVHISGPSGVGKERVAAAIHQCSPRAGGPFIRVNCGAIPETLLESEFFGHEKGAFTGAVKRKLGRFELADGGTLFLDEVAEIPLAMQVKLLRALQEQEFERVGGERSVKVNVRVVSATNRSLEDEVSEGRFREDLFYRLHVVGLQVPPLRDRKEDVVRLARYFLESLRDRVQPAIEGFAPDVEAALAAYHFPGNVRELSNIVEQALVFAEPPLIQLADLPVQVTRRASADGTALRLPRGDMGLSEYLESIERRLILEAYEAAHGVKTETARRLKLKTSALYYKLDKYGIGGGSTDGPAGN